ncbi:hypothetical protein BD309DRAFT_863524 [Dichomitus squalens]|uniref:Uncharacterized protein n=1 Tax=Dichomitus squalens TaxID=114155 RepID=A0A4Q9MCK8_9APHY|nr:hypothetical protein BD311DRAFT_673296 [Dichomitus squalens]TBU43835.1 hypothetical protein BD309DRAFT_863524 [Dichomitus squalens]
MIGTQIGPTRKVLNVSEVTIFSEPITSVLITRFLFDLQLVNRRAVLDQDSDSPPYTDMVATSSTLRFGSFIDSLGSTISSIDGERHEDSSLPVDPTQ